MKLTVTLVLVFSLFSTQSVGAYFHASNVRLIEDDAATNTTTTPSKDDLMPNSIGSSDSDGDGLINGSDVEPAGVEEPDFGIVGGGDIPTTTGIEHEDIGITGGGDDNDSNAELNSVATSTRAGTQYDESDFDFVNRLIELGAVFLKFDDVKGEAEDSSSDGDPDKPLITGRVYNDGKGNSGVIIKGKKILENDEIPALLETAPDAEDVSTKIELALYGARVARDNSGFNEIRMNDSQVSIDYRHGLRLLGFIKSAMPATVTITFGDGERDETADEFGRIKVQFPWWHIFGRKTVHPADIVSAYEEKASKGGDARLDTLTWMARDSRTLQTLSNIMKNVHDPGITLLQ